MKEYHKYYIRDSKKNNLISYIFDILTSFFVRSRPVLVRNPKKILFIRNDHIGDMAFCTSIYREIKRVFPKTQITVLADKNNKTLIEKDPNVDRIIIADRFWSKRTPASFFNYLNVLKEIKKENFDIGIDLRRSRMNILFYLFLGNVKNRISYYNLNGGKAFLTHPIFYDKKMNFCSENMVMLNKALGLDMKDFYPRIATDNNDKKDVNQYIKDNGLGNFIVVCPGATAKSKKWSSVKFKKFVEMFSKKHPEYKIVVSSGPGDEELVRYVCGNNKNCIPQIGYNLRKIGLFLKKAKAVIANDGGVRELAWMAGGKVIGLAGPLDLEIHAPLGDSKVIFHGEDKIYYDYAKEEYLNFKEGNIELILPEEVLEVVEKFMKKPRARYPPL